MPPRGGPEDKTPPSIVETFPENGALNVPTDLQIKIKFSERVSKRSFEDAFFISPLPSEEIRFHWRGKRVKISFGDTLKALRTYVVTIGSKTSDLRNNRMEQSYSLAFSTGPKIDEGKIAGHVFGDTEVGGTLVCAYQVAEQTSPDPADLLADYYTQCNENGEYQLNYIAPGKYRIFAIRDKDGDRKYSRGFEWIGVPNSDLILTESKMSYSDIDFWIFKEDTLAPYVKSAFAIDKFRVDVRFNEAVEFESDSAEANFFRIVEENEPQNELKIKQFYQDSRQASVFHFITEAQKEISYKFMAENLCDLAGNSLDTAYNLITFEGSSLADTVKPKLIFQSIEDSSKGIYPDSSLFFIFSEPMNGKVFERNFHLYDQNQKPVKGKFFWKNPAHVKFIPDSSLEFAASYQIIANIDSIFDLHGNPLADSVFSVFFTTLSRDTLTAISGNFLDEQIDAQGDIHLFATNGEQNYHLILDDPGSYAFKEILPGIYTLHGFRDEDKNGKFSAGTAIPFIPSERFVFYSDSIKVRSRWPNEGNDIILKKKFSER